MTRRIWFTEITIRRVPREERIGPLKRENAELRKQVADLEFQRKFIATGQQLLKERGSFYTLADARARMATLPRH